MIEHPKCPVCDHENWQTLGRREFRADDLRGLNDYLRRRYEVLFNIWVPGQPSFVARWLLCEHCGFVIYSPRPTSDDLDRKYKYLCGLDNDHNATTADSAAEQQRARRLARLLRRYLPSSGRARILDYGGGDGRLMSKLVADGHDCSVIDYCDSVIPGVKKLGDTLAQATVAKDYDIIVCSHVMEHVAEPLQVVSGLRECLAGNGLLFIEVPMEIWRQPPRLDEPVTHVNFFTPASLRVLLERAGFAVSRCRVERVKVYDNYQPLLRCWARPAPAIRQIDNPGAKPTRDLLSPNFATRIWYALLLRQHLAAVVWQRSFSWLIGANGRGLPEMGSSTSNSDHRRSGTSPTDSYWTPNNGV